MRRQFICMLLCLFFLSAAPLTIACAEKDVTVEQLKYGSEAMELHSSNQINTFSCEGITYQLEDKWFEFAPAVELWGGKTRAVYEYTVPQNVLSEYADTACMLGTITISPVVKTTLVIGEGNRLSGEFTLSDPIELTDVYTEQISLPRSEQGEPVLIDKLYLYSFEEGGEQQHYAASFYVDYDGVKASHRGAASEETPEVSAEGSTSAAEPAITADAEKQGSPWLFALAGIVLAAAVCLIVLRKKPAKPVKAAAAESPADDLAEIQALAENVRDGAVRADLRRFIDLCIQIRKAVQEKPEKTAQTHKFFGYYVPTVKRLITHLVTTEQRTTQPEEMDKALNTVRYGVKMACTAAEKQLTNMYRSEQMDADADITVMENMLKMDGFTDEPSPFAVKSEKE